MVREENATIDMVLEEDLIFKSTFSYKKLQSLYIDENIEKKDDLWGPDAAQLLGMAVTGCLCASFVFCLSKRGLSVDNLDAHAEVSFRKTDKNYTRIKDIKVKLVPKANNKDTLKRIKQCMKEIKGEHMFFEETCIITPSVRDGIDIKVDVEL
ncbi:MAG: hypothetical protein GF383_04535 [Candidatus Lokiarchaeota archaeon]|nr:hypothetical protein [Candidatus Lokiarchaeota archaeon]MBD3339052.1 hypothetical protein [Candidatus Lokiarchaeota archaeon]